MLVSGVAIASPIQHAIVHQKRNIHRTCLPKVRLRQYEVDRITQLFVRPRFHPNRGLLARPSPTAGRERSDVLDEVRLGVVVRHADDRLHPVRVEFLDRRTLRRRRVRLGHVLAAALGQHHGTHQCQPSLHSRYYTPVLPHFLKPNPSFRV